MICLGKQKDKVFELLVQPTLPASSLQGRAALPGRKCLPSAFRCHTLRAHGLGPALWEGVMGWALSVSASRLLAPSPSVALGMQNIVILNCTVLRCLCNFYNHHLTNNPEQALIASNAVLWLGCRERRDVLTVTALL